MIEISWLNLVLIIASLLIPHILWIAAWRDLKDLKNHYRHLFEKRSEEYFSVLDRLNEEQLKCCAAVAELERTNKKSLEKKKNN